MPWKMEKPMDQKIQFVAEAIKGQDSMAGICERFGISRKTGYKWVQRYLETGPEALEDRSRSPEKHPNQTRQEVVDALLAGRRKHVSWGPRKLLWLVEQEHPDWRLPNPSTVTDILNRHGMIQRKRKRRRPGHPGKPTIPVLAPNDAWSADFKGHFRMLNGVYCYPLTVTDNFSRYLLCCQAMLSPNIDDTQAVMTRVFREHGLPARIRTDNGGPFAASDSLGRLSRLSAWWIRLGIQPEFIELGKPQQNGRHERMHKTLKDETTRPPAGSLRAQQNKFNAFCAEFNNDRPHEALKMHTPVSVHQPSRREMPRRILPLEYPAHFETRYVSANGGIRWNGDWVNVSSVCVGEYVGMEEVEDAIWDVYYGPYKLGKFHERHLRIEDAYGRLVRK